MVRKKTEDDKTQEKGELIPFKLIEGGRLALDAEPPDLENWLDNLPLGTLFLIGDKRSADYISPEYEVLDKVEGHVRLKLWSPTTNNQIEHWVISPRFCQRYFLSKIIGGRHRNG